MNTDNLTVWAPFTVLLWLHMGEKEVHQLTCGYSIIPETVVCTAVENSCESWNLQHNMWPFKSKANHQSSRHCKLKLLHRTFVLVSIVTQQRTLRKVDWTNWCGSQIYLLRSGRTNGLERDWSRFYKPTPPSKCHMHKEGARMRLVHPPPFTDERQYNETDVHCFTSSGNDWNLGIWRVIKHKFHNEYTCGYIVI